MSTITKQQQEAIADILVGMTLPSGLGDEHSACSLAAINLALSGRLTDRVPDCMSDVVGSWIIGVQDAMPDAMRNSSRWKDLLPLAAGTGKMHEKGRFKIISDWMWGTVITSCQPMADRSGFGAAWLRMTTEKTHEAANAATKAAEAAAYAAWAADAADAAADAANAAYVADAAAYAAAYAADAAQAASAAASAANAAEAANAAADAAADASECAECAEWDRFDPCTLLQKLAEVSG
jgi:hypothetical protein